MLELLATSASFLRPFLAFILILLPLVVFHEFGHFIFARIFGVKAEIFSVGFGPKLWSRQWGETEFRLAAIPMGGFVKLLGEDREAQLTEEELKRSLSFQKPWKRFFIFFGGPLFNFILAILIFMTILMLGEPQMASFVGRVVHDSPAERAGFQSGDQILEVNHRPISKYEEFVVALNENPNRQIQIKVKHPSDTQLQTLEVRTSEESGLGVYGESTQVGHIEGLLPLARATQVGVSNPHSLAAQGGISTGDQIVSYNGKELKTWEELEVFYAASPSGQKLTLGVHSAKPALGMDKKRFWSIVEPSSSRGLGEDLGLFSSELFVERVVPKSPAEKMGLQAGDRLIAVGDVEPQSFFDLREQVQKSGEREGVVRVKWERQGQILQATVTPSSNPVRDVSLNKEMQYTIGVAPLLVLTEPPMVVERILNPIRLVVTATQRMVTFTERNLISLRKMALGEVSMGQLGGPITIGKIAGESLARGLIVFLTNMAIFSIGLGVLNILPVPVLDGGHLLLLGVEMIRGRPLSLRQMEIVQGLGLLFILVLMGIAFHNDISRLF